MKPFLFLLFLCFFSLQNSHAQKELDLPDTGISGVYEVMTGVEDMAYALKYFGDFGFTVVDSAEFSEEKAYQLYGVQSALKSYRLQNGTIDSHGLLRIWVWEKPLGRGVGYAPPETIGQRMAVMRTEDIFRLDDIYNAARLSGEKWLPTEPIADDLFGLDDKKKDFFNRPVIVRENGVYGEFFNHVFFQRYGYHIPGYGTVGKHSKLKTSEFTHNDFIVKGDINDLHYLQTALGLQNEKTPEIDGDWLMGPKRVFQMNPGDSHWYWGFVSPNNICGKLKFFVPIGQKTDRSEHQRVGELGITMHSFYTSKLKKVFDLVLKNPKLTATAVMKNEFGERCFVFKGPLGCSWQIIEKRNTKHTPLKKLDFQLVD